MARLDQGWHVHPRVLSLGLPAMGLHAWSISYCDHAQSDGFIPTGAWPALPGAGAAVKTLLAHGLWERCDGGFRLHDYLDYNRSKAEIAEYTQAKQAAGRAGGHAKAASKPPGKTLAPAKADALADALANGLANGWQKATPGPGPRVNHSLSTGLSTGSVTDRELTRELTQTRPGRARATASRRAADEAEALENWQREQRHERRAALSDVARD